MRGENDGGDAVSSGPTTLPADDPKTDGAARRWFPRLRDTRIRSKLALILVVPVAAVLALATVRLVAVGQGAYDATLVHSLTSLSVDVSALTQEIHKERMAAAAFLADPASKVEPYNLHVRRTDERIAAYNAERRDLGDVPPAVRDRLRAIDDHLATLNGTRQEVLDRKQMPVAEAVLRYGVILTDLVAYGEVLGQVSGDSSVAQGLRAVSAFARAKAATAEEEAVAFAALSSGQLDEEQFSSFVATLTSQQEALLAFSLVATPEQQTLVNSTVTGDAVVLADRLATDVSRSVGQKSAIGATDAGVAIGAVTDLMRWAELRLEERLLAQADQARADVVQQAIIESVLVLVALVVAIALAVLLARSLNDSLRRLREGALSVANRDLPDAVSRLRDVGSVDEGDVEEIVRQVRDPIRLSNKDEIGQVAQAFNVVHKEAVRVAAEQAALRTNVSTMFLNLARRSQTLVDRMIGELDQIERGEEDPKRLAQLFELDHLATRMRRNDENLLVLAGADSTAPRREDALLVDALRAAQSEVELYNRIEFGTVDTDIAVAAHAVNDVVRLLAELLDNATRFSPPNTAVVADARRIRDYVLVQVEDRGLGLTDEQIDVLNRRLSAPPTVDVAAFRLMGLAVVSRLSSRYDIRVELRRNIEGGIVAQVTLPSSTVVLPTPRAREQVLGRRQQLAVESGPAAAVATRPPVVPLPAPAPNLWPDPVGTPAGRHGAAANGTERWGGVSRTPWPAPVKDAGQPANAPAHQVTVPAAAPDLGAGTPRLPKRVPGGDSIGGAGVPPVAAPSAGLPSGPVARTPFGMPTVRPGAGAGAPVARPVTAAAPAGAKPEEPGELPIFREMEAVWFRAHGQDSTQIFRMPPEGAAGGSAPWPAEPVAGARTGAVVGRYAVPVGTPAAPTRAPLPARSPGQSTPGPSAAPAQPAPDGPAEPPAPYTPPTAVPTQRAAGAAEPAGPGEGTGAWRTAADEGWARATRAAAPANAGTTRSGLPKRVPQAQLVPGGIEPKGERERTRRTPDEVRGLLSAYHRGVQRGRSAGTDQNGTS
jgi:HAMP domain-containing protein